MDNTPDVRPFAAWLEEQRGGELATELGESLRTLATAVVTHGKPGSVTLKITVKPSGKGARDGVIVADSVTVKKPEGDRPEVFYFLDESTNLCRTNPAQLSVFEELREVPNITELKELP